MTAFWEGFDLEQKIDPVFAATQIGNALAILSGQGEVTNPVTAAPTDAVNAQAAAQTGQVTANGQTVSPVGDAPHDEPGQQFGAPRDGGARSHEGLDFGVPEGTAVASYSGGTVIFAGEAGDAGNMVTVDHGGGIITKYMHLSTINVSVGQQIGPGELLGMSGSTGAGTGPHLHFQVEQDGRAVDPGPFLAGGNAIIGQAPADPTVTTVKSLPPEEIARIQITKALQMLSGQPVSAESVADTTTTTPAPGQPNPARVSTEGGPAEWIREAMRLTGVGEDWFEGLMARMQQESGGDPTAINDWDSNAAAGTPSKGLMQTIDPTFEAHKLPGLDDIWNPVHNAVAAIRYIQSRYGHVNNLPRGGY